MDALSRQIEALERRCAQIERANRRWRGVAMAMLTAAAVALGCASKAAQGTVECEQLIVRDGGKLLAMLGKAGGGASLSLCDSSEKPRATLSTDKDGASVLQFVNSAGKYQYGVALTANGRVSQEMWDKADRSGVLTKVFEDGTAMSMVVTKDKRAAGMTIDELGLPDMRLDSADGKPRFRCVLTGAEGNPHGVAQQYIRPDGSYAAFLAVHPTGDVMQSFNGPRSSIFTEVSASGVARCAVLRGQQANSVFEFGP